MLFRLTNAQDTFQCLINDIFQDMFKNLFYVFMTYWYTTQFDLPIYDN